MDFACLSRGNMLQHSNDRRASAEINVKTNAIAEQLENRRHTHAERPTAEWKQQKASYNGLIVMSISLPLHRNFTVNIARYGYLHFVCIVCYLC